MTIDVRSKKVINKRKSSGSTVVKKKNKSSGVLSGKVLGFEIPGVSGLLRNKTAQKIMLGAGAVSLGLALVQLVNNPTLNKFAAKKEVRILAAGAAGDIPGAAFQLFKEGGIKSLNLGGNGQTATQQQTMFDQAGLA